LPYRRDVSSYGLEVLSEEECRALLVTQRVGRVGVCGAQPLIVPVLYGLLDGDVVFRTAPGEKLLAAALNRTMAFEIDAFDVETKQGWSVDVVGEAEEIRDPEQRTRAEALALEPWAGEARDRYVRIRARHVTGRRIAATPA
jgi:nitroimidazol reductase NimA-like FMN-containing flavoprotein (pyridoxamine 5'-phosphate oxidase superfamily)